MSTGPTTEFVMTAVFADRKLVWRLAGVGTAVIAVGLAAVGIALAFQQATSVSQRLAAESTARAAKVAGDAVRMLQERTINALGDVADSRVDTARKAWPKPRDWPSWIDGVYVLDPTGLQVLEPTRKRTSYVARLVEAQLAVRGMQNATAGFFFGIDWVFERHEGQPVVLALLEAIPVANRQVSVVGHISLVRLRSDLLQPLIEFQDGLEIVPAGDARGAQAAPMDLALRYWAIQPSQSYLNTQSRGAVGQTFTYVGLMILSLATVLVAMWLLTRLTRRELALAKDRADFVANVSHELKTPLALIRMFGETLASGRVHDPEKRSEYYRIISRESERLTNLINNVLDFSSMNAGQQVYRLEPIDIGQVVRETYEAYSLQLEDKQFEHSLTIAEDLPAVRADRDAVSQALVNLIGNAVKYSDDDRFLAIEVMADTRRNRRGVLISVHDRGIGIGAEDRRHLFEGFFRSNDERVRTRGGAGLGLAVLKHIVDAHGGTLHVESRLVKGSTFRIFLPVNQVAPDASAAIASSDGAVPERPSDQSGASGDQAKG